jgi:hypothetical protein
VLNDAVDRAVVDGHVVRMVALCSCPGDDDRDVLATGERDRADAGGVVDVIRGGDDVVGGGAGVAVTSAAPSATRRRL